MKSSVIRTGWTVLVALLAGFASAQEVVISEFLSSNSTTLLDEDGDSSDYVELYNPGSSAVNLDGWHLTDDQNTPDKWTFPAVEIGAGSFLIVFASDKDRRDPDSELHTNFQLDSGGEFLALINADARVESAFSPSFPEQLTDTSYGITMQHQSTGVVDDDTALRYLVPSNNDLGLDWIAPNFDDAGWSAGEAAIGFDEKSTPSFDGDLRTNISGPMRGNTGSVYLRIPFEVTEAGFVSLDMQYDDGFVAYLNGVEIARDRAPDDLTWDATAARSQSSSGATQFHRIQLSGAAVAVGTNVLAIHGLNSTANGSDFIIRPRISISVVESYDLGDLRFYTLPSPGQPNTDGRIGVAAEPVYSMDGGLFDGEIELTLTAEGDDAEIRYTTDSSTPTASSTLYSEPLTIRALTTIRAKTFRPGYVPSKINKETFMAASGSLLNFKTKLPVIIIQAQGTIGENAFQKGIITTFNRTDGEENSFADSFARSNLLGIKTHGSSSQGFQKKNFRIELQDEFGEDRSRGLLGLPSSSDWVLHGPFSDKSLMRNALSYQWSNQIGWIAPKTRFVEVYLSQRYGTLGQGHYWGVYLLVQRIKRSPGFVDIEKVLPSHTSEPEITGGYIVKHDRLDPGDAGLRTSRGIVLGLVEPKEQEITATQRSWLTNYFRQFETALYGNNFADPERGYAAYIDVPSWIDHHIIVELCKQIDGYRLSTHLYKDRNGKLIMGPCWDYNLSLGNADYLNGFNPVGWYYPQISGNQYPWYPRLFQDPAFKEAYDARWLELRGDALALRNLYNSIDDYTELLSEAAPRNFQKWRIMGTRVWPNWFIAQSWDEEVDWMRNNWLTRRVAWMDSQLGIGAPSFSHPGGPVEPNFEVEIINEIGDAYYTINGGDPMGEDGSIAPDAVKYEQAIVLDGNPRLRARSKYGTEGWTDMIEAVWVTDPLPIVCTEIMYNPVDDEDADFRSSDYEFIEFKNIGDEPIDLTTLRMQGGSRMRFEFAEGNVPTLAPGEYVVVVNNLEAFEHRYGANVNVAGEFESILSNAAMTIEVLTDDDRPMVTFKYEDWYTETDGDGYSMVIRDENGLLSLWNDEAGWRASLDTHGSPGRADALLENLRIPGDVNSDATFDISDPVGILRHLFFGQDLSICDSEQANLAFFDINGDEMSNLTDAVHALNYLFRDGAPPALGVGCVEMPGCPTACE